MPKGLFKQVTLTFNPWNEKHWLKKRFFDKADNDILAKTTNYQCNEFLDDSDRSMFERMRLNNPRRYQVAGLGDWGIVEGLVYENWEERAFDTAEIARRESVQSAFGLDFGYTNDPSALFCGLVDMKAREIYVFDEMYKKGLTNEMIYQEISRMGYSKENITADSAEPKSIAQLRALGLTRIHAAKKGRDSILNGIQLIQDYKIVIHPRCVNFLTEIGNYTWDKDKFDNQVNKPIDDFNHCLSGDTLVHTVEGWKQIAELVGQTGMIHCYDEIYQSPAIEEFHSVRQTGVKQTFDIEMEDGTVLHATEDHPVLTKIGWKKVCELTTDDEILKINHC